MKRDHGHSLSPEAQVLFLSFGILPSGGKTLGVLTGKAFIHELTAFNYKAECNVREDVVHGALL
jgi:hypothetical protein